MTMIGPSHKSHNALENYTTMHNFVTEMCTFLLQNGTLCHMGLVHCEICATGLLLWPLYVLLQYIAVIVSYMFLEK